MNIIKVKSIFFDKKVKSILKLTNVLLVKYVFGNLKMKFRKKLLFNDIIDFEIHIFCDNYIEYCSAICLLIMEELRIFHL